MSAITPTIEQFLDEYPEFSDTRTATVESRLAQSIKLLEPGVWDDFYAEAVMLDAAHNLAMKAVASQPGGMGSLQGAAGPLTSVSVGGISTSFATPEWDGKSRSENWYMKTSYGQEFLRLRASVVAPGCLA